MVRPIGDPIVELADVAGQALSLLEWALGHASQGDLPSDEWLLRVERSMDRAGRLLEACGRLGLEQRRVRIDEDRLDLMAAVMRRAWAELGQDQDDPRVQAALDVAYSELGE